MSLFFRRMGTGRFPLFLPGLLYLMCYWLMVWKRRFFRFYHDAALNKKTVVTTSLISIGASSFIFMLLAFIFKGAVSSVSDIDPKIYHLCHIDPGFGCFGNHSVFVVKSQ